MLTSHPLTAHSAQVQMHLETGGARLPIAQLGPDFIIMAEMVECVVSRATLSLCVDAEEERWPVELPDGLAAAGLRTRIVNLA